eukprot:TRINITY_DN9846_c0_g1_i1.p1 TRINITY_DN9846_c0_g1~~TRINITY_DN9846_c0_g1_i1.p1  ORF type:complete len:130 (+),score=52.60 TRINITY_DN9846_c0_g1_i1:55-444(+)
MSIKNAFNDAFDVKKFSEEGKKRTLYSVVQSNNNQVTFGIETVEPLNEVPFHYHDNNEEIIFIKSGKARVWLSDDNENEDVDYVELKEFDVIYIPPKRKHRILNYDEEEQLIFTWTFTPGLQINQFAAK